MKVLVTGGAGYIGSNMLLLLQQSNYDLVCLDNLSTGHKDLICCENFVEGDLSDRLMLEKLFYENRFDAVVHFAASSQVGESVKNPGKYYRNNVSNTQTLLDVMVEHNVKNIVFSSTAAVFGNPEYLPIDESHPRKAISPYGKTKLLVETMLDDYDLAHNLKSVSLRYFNAAGADPQGRVGERHFPETHLIPLVLQVASGKKKNIEIFGADYDTQDGTCIRDFVHVSDLCDAHILALEWLSVGGKTRKFNIGNGSGFSVQNVIDTAQAVTGRSISRSISNRRLGDPKALVADPGLIKRDLGWQPKYSNLDEIIDHAWRWELGEKES
jgi:UDP-glucose 4-epimerase